MYIQRIRIENFKCFKNLDVSFNEKINILVGNNEAGKSTILEAINLALTGQINGRYLKNDINQYLFNNEVVEEYLRKINNGENPLPPCICIEIFFGGKDFALFEGDYNSLRQKFYGLSYKIAFNDSHRAEYDVLVSSRDLVSLPIEYYDVFWQSFARESITSFSIPIKPAFIDSSSYKYQNGSDVYISRIVKEFLTKDDAIKVSQAHRKMKDSFVSASAIAEINLKIKEEINKISEKEVSLSVETSSKNAWETSLMTYLDKVPFHNIGKGEQCLIKTKLALSSKQNKDAKIILIEEPENHLSHSKLNQFISEIKKDHQNKQIIISTHSSFVSNKLNLGNLIFFDNKKPVPFSELKEETKTFFEKLAGYDTLRLVFCERAILVEGDSDELIVQKAFQLNDSEKRLPIEAGVDVISVGTSFLNFLEIANKINKRVHVVTDNDGNIKALEKSM
ncbi:putative ATP-dependent endonuclease of OLD family [Elusimicrobium posterum]|uniref:ATP-dependent nuclease n=1 Tax=Elusimicrobium posterum TaxID=3116653 RepID=UPI003C73926F